LQPTTTDFDPSQEDPGLPPDVPDRSTWIAVFAIAQILIGALVLMMVPLGVVGQVVGATLRGESFSSARLTGMLIASVMYLLVGGVMISCGIGAVRRRRWARVLALVYSMIWLLCGIVGMAWIALVLPSVAGTPMGPGGARLPAAVRVAVVVVSLVLGAGIYVILPGAIAFFHSRPSVKANFECLDPRPGWTDACPLPVLGMSGFMLLVALGLLAAIPTGSMFFGRVLTGLPGAALALGSAGVVGVLAWGLYRLSLVAWWGTLGWTLFSFSSWGVTMESLTVEEFYAAMGAGESGEQAARMMAEVWWMMPWMVVVTGAVVFGYLLWVRRYFPGGGKYVAGTHSEETAR
jgi:hypothetical protein